jgi:hypothetical protein
MLGCLEEWWLGGIYSPNHQSGRWGRLLSYGAPDTVRCASHVTQPLGFDRWSFWHVGHQTVRWCTGQVLFTVRCAICACSDFCARSPRTVALLADRSTRPLLCLTQRTVRWIIAEWLPENPKLASLKLISLVHRTLSGGTRDSPVVNRTLII